MSMKALGRVCNVVGAASGKHIDLSNAEGVLFVSYLDAGTQTVTLKESIDGASEQALVVIDEIFKCPGIGGTWTRVTQTAAASYDLTTDATNDMFVVDVRARELSAGFNSVEATADSGILMAFVYDLNDQMNPTSLPTSITA